MQQCVHTGSTQFNVTFDVAFWYVLYLMVLWLESTYISCSSHLCHYQTPSIKMMDDLRNHTNDILAIKEKKKKEPLYISNSFSNQANKKLLIWIQGSLLVPQEAVALLIPLSQCCQIAHLQHAVTCLAKLIWWNQVCIWFKGKPPTE